MVKRFKDAFSESLWDGTLKKGFPAKLARLAQLNLALVLEAPNVKTLATPPGNRLEALKGNRKGQYSIRINAQWRICFKWDGSQTYDIEVTDYH